MRNVPVPVAYAPLPVPAAPPRSRPRSTLFEAPCDSRHKTEDASSTTARAFHLKRVSTRVASTSPRVRAAQLYRVLGIPDHSAEQRQGRTCTPPTAHHLAPFEVPYYICKAEYPPQRDPIKLFPEGEHAARSTVSPVRGIEFGSPRGSFPRSFPVGDRSRTKLAYAMRQRSKSVLDSFGEVISHGSRGRAQLAR